MPDVALKRYARRLAPVFEEAWDELREAEETPRHTHLTWRHWVVLPKVEGARTTAKLRDIEMGNGTRKVLARMLFRVLEEQAATGLSVAQQPFLQGREISRNTIKMLTAFWNAAERAQEKPGDDPALFLLVDCS